MHFTLDVHVVNTLTGDIPSMNISLNISLKFDRADGVPL